MMNHEQVNAAGGGYGPPGGAPPGGYGGPPPGAPPGGFGGPPPGAPPGGFGGPPPGAPPGGYGGAPPGAPPGGAFGAPPGGAFGAPPQGAPMGGAPMGGAPGGAGAPLKNSTLAVVSLVTGILAIIPCCNWYIMWLVAIITGILAKKEIKEKPGLKGDGMALAGIILGALSLVIMIIITIIQIASGALNQLF